MVRIGSGIVAGKVMISSSIRIQHPHCARSTSAFYTWPRQNIVFVYATRIILHNTALHNVSGIAVNTLLVGYPRPKLTLHWVDRGSVNALANDIPVNFTHWRMLHFAESTSGLFKYTCKKYFGTYVNNYYNNNQVILKCSFQYWASFVLAHFGCSYLAVAIMPFKVIQGNNNNEPFWRVRYAPEQLDACRFSRGL